MVKHEISREYCIQKYEEYRQKVAGWIDRIWKATPKTTWVDRVRNAAAIPDDDYEQSEDYKQALKFYRDFEEKDGVDYSAIVDYARELYDKYDKTDKLLDEKADSIIKYLGGGSALITFGALVSIRLDSPWTCILGCVALIALLPSLVCAILAVRQAIHVRRPRSSASLPDVKFAVDMAEHYKNKESLALNLWLIFYPICEAAYYRNLQKANLVESAHKLYLAAMGFLVVPVVAIALCLLVIATQVGRPGQSGQQGQPPPAIQKP